MTASDMVFDRNMNPAWCGSPEGTAGWLRYQKQHNPLLIRGYTVRTGWPQEFLTVDEYLRRRRGGNNE